MSLPPTAQEVRERSADLGSQEHVGSGCGLDRPASLGKGPDSTHSTVTRRVSHTAGTQLERSHTRAPTAGDAAGTAEPPPHRDKSRVRRIGGHRAHAVTLGMQSEPAAGLKTAQPAGQR